MKLKAHMLPAADGHCGWIETLTPPGPARTLSGEERADCAVVGAGFTGVAAARRIAELHPDWRVVVLEAQRVGAGASGRNAGFVVDVGYYMLDVGPEEASRFLRVNRAGVEELRRRVREHRIDCGWREGKDAWLHVAASDAGQRLIDHLPRWLDELGEPYEQLDQDRVEEIVGSRFYRAGVRLPGGALVDTGALVRGLAASLPENVDLYERSPVERIEGPDPYRVETAGGSLRAQRVVLALNGYSHSFGLLTDRVFPLYTYVSMTRPLSDREQAKIGGERSWGVLGYDPLGSSIRRTRDQRLLVRNVFDYSRRLQLEERRRQEVAEEHRRILQMRFPMLDGVELEYVWGGIISMTRGSRVPFIGRLGPGLVTIAGYGGAGIAMSNIGGRLVADLLLDADSELLDDLQSLPDPRWVPPPPILGPVARLQLRKLHRAASAVY